MPAGEEKGAGVGGKRRELEEKGVGKGDGERRESSDTEKKKQVREQGRNWKGKGSTKEEGMEGVEIKRKDN